MFLPIYLRQIYSIFTSLCLSDKTANQLLKPISELKIFKRESIRELVVKAGITTFDEFALKFEKLTKDTMEVLEEGSLGDIRNCFLVQNNDSLIELVNKVEKAHLSPMMFKKQKVEHADHFLGIRFTYKDLQWNKEWTGMSFCWHFAKRVDDKFDEILNQVAKEHNTTGEDIQKALIGFGFDNNKTRSWILRKANNRLDATDDLDASLVKAIDNILLNTNLSVINGSKGIDKKKMTVTGYLAMLFKISSSEAVDFVTMSSNKTPLVKSILRKMTLSSLIAESGGIGTVARGIKLYNTNITPKMQGIASTPLLFSRSITVKSTVRELQLSPQEAEISGAKIPDDDSISFERIYMKMFTHSTIPLTYHQFKLLSIKDILDLYAMEEEQRSFKKIKQLVSNQMTRALKIHDMGFVYQKFDDFVTDMQKPFSVVLNKLTGDIEDLTALGLPQSKINVLKTISRRYTLYQLLDIADAVIDYSKPIVYFLDAVYKLIGKPCKCLYFYPFHFIGPYNLRIIRITGVYACRSSKLLRNESLSFIIHGPAKIVFETENVSKRTLSKFSVGSIIVFLILLIYTFSFSVIEMFIDIPYNIVLEMCNASSEIDLKVLFYECAGIDTAGPNPFQYGFSSLMIEPMTGAYQDMVWKVDNSTQDTIRQLVMLNAFKAYGSAPFFNPPNTDAMKNTTCDVLEPLTSQMITSDVNSRTNILLFLGAISSDPKDPIFDTGLYELLGDNYMDMKDLRRASVQDIAGLMRLRSVPDQQSVLSKLSHVINRCQKRSILFEDKSYAFEMMNVWQLQIKCGINFNYLKMAYGEYNTLPLGMTLGKKYKEGLKDMKIYSLVYRSSIFTDQLARRTNGMTIQELAASNGMDKETVMSRPIREVGPKLLSVSEEVFMRHSVLPSSINVSQSLREFGRGKVSKGMVYRDGMILMRRFNKLSVSFDQKINVARLMNLPLKQVFHIVGESFDNATTKTIYEFMEDHFGFEQKEAQAFYKKASTDGTPMRNLTIRTLLQVSRRVQPDGDADHVNFYRLYEATEHHANNGFLYALGAPIRTINETASNLKDVFEAFPNKSTGEMITKFIENHYGEPYGSGGFVRDLIGTPFKEMALKLMTTEDELKGFEVITLADYFETSKFLQCYVYASFHYLFCLYISHGVVKSSI